MNSKRFISHIASAAVIALAATLALATAPADAQQPADDDGEANEDLAIEQMPVPDDVVVVYRGVLQNTDGDPVSGVFPLDFHLYRGDMSADSIWSETHFVSVVDGRYQVRLGAQNPLAEHLLEGERWLGIELRGETEILRDRLTVERPASRAETEEFEEGSRVSYADVAERAAEAERARVAQTARTLDGLTAEEIEQKADLALRRLGEHVADPDAHQAVTGPSVGSRVTTAGEEVGGSGGTSYEIRCPDGQVAVGIKGGAGRVVDSITLLCSPLE